MTEFCLALLLPLLGGEVSLSHSAQEFGSAHTQKKLAAVQSYLSAFTTALKKQSFRLIYIDACAGSGSSKPKQRADQAALLDVDDVTMGSAVRAMQIDTPFDQYSFSEIQPTLKAIEQLAGISPPTDLPHLIRAKAVAEWEEESWAEIREANSV